MKVVVIINPIAGASQRAPLLRAMLKHLAESGHEALLHRTAGPAEAISLARRAAAEVDFVVAGGGDGTVREVVEGLMGRGVPLLIWPTGTENLVAKSFGFHADPRLIARCIAEGRTQAVDLGLANGRPFTVVCGMGFDAEVVHRLSRVRRGHISHLNYIEPIWRTFWEHKFPLMRVLYEGRLFWEGRGLVFVGNVARYSLGLPVIRDATPHDGLLDLLILPCCGRLKLVGHSLRTLLAMHIEHGGARYLRCRRLRVESPVPVPAELDGDDGGFLPIDFEIRPAALQVRLPPGWDLRPRCAGPRAIIKQCASILMS